MNNILRFLERFIFWIQNSSYLKCKHFCPRCKFYHQCKRELEEEVGYIDEYIDMTTKF